MPFFPIKSAKRKRRPNPNYNVYPKLPLVDYLGWPWVTIRGITEVMSQALLCIHLLVILYIFS